MKHKQISTEMNTQHFYGVEVTSNIPKEVLQVMISNSYKDIIFAKWIEKKIKSLDFTTI